MPDILVNGERVPAAAIDQEAQSLRQRFQQVPEAQRQAQGLDAAQFEKNVVEWARENLIERTLLRQEADKDNEPIDEAQVTRALDDVQRRHGGEEKFREKFSAEQIEGMRREIEARLKLDRLVAQLGKRQKPLKQKDIAAFYRKNRERFQTPEMLWAAHIVKHVNEETSEQDAKAAIDAIQARLDAGEDFEDVADTASDCPGNRGDLGSFPRGQMVQEFDDVAFELEPGTVSSVFRTPFGFHIAKVYDRKPAGYRSLAEVQEEIKRELEQGRQTEALENFVDTLKESAKIEDAPDPVTAEA